MPVSRVRFSCCKVLFSVILLFFFFIGRSSTYYFSSLGNDNYSAAQAQNAITPWKTISKLNSFMPQLKPGDSILFKTGDIFYGSIAITVSGKANNPVVFGSYGKGAKPVITGFSKFSNWQNVASNIYQCTSPLLHKKINMVLVNNIQQAPGRYPNNGYLTYESCNSNISITDNQLNASPNWAGGDVIIKKNRWVIDRNYITSHNGTTISYTSQTSAVANPGFGYFISNHPAALDVNGEWYSQPSGNKVGVYTNKANGLKNILFTTLDTLLCINNKAYISFNNLAFKGANLNAIDLYKASNIIINKCEADFSGLNALNLINSNNITVSYCTIDHTNNIALNAGNTTGGTFAFNTITNTGTIAGAGEGGSNSYQAIILNGDNWLIQYNRIINTGFTAISFNGSNITIRYNQIQKFGMMKDDGAGIYTWNNDGHNTSYSNRKIYNNLIIDGVGAPAGTTDTGYRPMHGIYMDDNSANVIIEANTIADCAQNGLYIHNAHNITINGNTVYNNREQFVCSHDNVATNAPVKNLNVKNNIFFSKTTAQTVVECKTIEDDITRFSSFDSNYYVRPLDDELVFRLSYKRDNVYNTDLLSLKGWQDEYSKDKHAHSSPVALPAYNVNFYTGSNKITNGSFSADINGLYCYSATNSCSASWSSFNGGSLQFKNPSVAASALLIISAGSVIAGKNYVLSFKMKTADQHKNVQVFLRKSLSDYADISDRTYVEIPTKFTATQLSFTALQTQTDVSLVFEIPSITNPLFLDDLNLREANITITNPDDVISFYYNATLQNKHITLNGNYVSVYNDKYTGNLTVAPGKSIVLIKSEINSFSNQLIPIASNNYR